MQYRNALFDRAYNDDTLSGEVFTIIMPLLLIPDADPEIIIQQQGLLKEFLVKYVVGDASVLGPLTIHSIAQCSYKEGYCIFLTINVSYINVRNVKQLMFYI
jgi:hypothetical protein